MTYANLTTSQRNDALRDIRRFWMIRNSMMARAEMANTPIDRAMYLNSVSYFNAMIAGYREALHMLNGDSLAAWKF